MWLRSLLGLIIFGMVIGVPIYHFRANYAHAKRLRIVSEGHLYRCGQLTAEGFREAHKKYQFRTVINLQEESPDPLMPEDYLKKPTIRESALLEQLGVRYYLLEFDLPGRDQALTTRPKVIDKFLKIMDAPEAHPVLLHCKAGLHRTGILTAIYRMEYEGWSKRAAVRELRANGFGDAACTTANDYIFVFLENYRTRFAIAVSMLTPAAELLLRGEDTP